MFVPDLKEKLHASQQIINHGLCHIINMTPLGPKGFFMETLCRTRLKYQNTRGHFSFHDVWAGQASSHMNADE